MFPESCLLILTLVCACVCIQVLNEVVVDRGPSSYLSNVDLYLDGRLITSVQGDGKGSHYLPYSLDLLTFFLKLSKDCRVKWIFHSRVTTDIMDQENYVQVKQTWEMNLVNIPPLSVLQEWLCPHLQAAQRTQPQQEPPWSTPMCRPSWSPPSAHTRSPSGPSWCQLAWSSW